MRFGGLQKLTLLDYPDKTACTLFTTGCNYRCPFCHNASLVFPNKDIAYTSDDEVLRFLHTRRGLLDGVCITGGEPLLHDELAVFLGKVKEMGFLIKLDTNGSFPAKLKSLVRESLVDYVAMDIKNAKSKYGQTIGLGQYNVASVEESVSFLLEGSIPYEFRTTVVRELHTEEDLVSLSKWIKGTERYFLQAFVDSGDVLEDGYSAYDEAEMKRLLLSVQKIIPAAELRGL